MAKKYKCKFNKSHIFRFWPFFLITVVFLSTFFLSLNIFFLNKAYLNVYFSNRSYSGFDKTEIFTSVHNILANFGNSKITYALGDIAFDSTLIDLGVNFDEKLTADRVFHYCRNSGFLKSMQCKIESFFIKTTIKPAYSIDFIKFNSVLDKEFANIDKMSVDSEIIYERGQYIITPSKFGEVIDRSNLIKELANIIDDVSYQQISLNTISDEPAIVEDQLANVLSAIKIIEKKSVTLVFGFDKWNLSGSELVNMFNLDKLRNSYSSKINFGFLSNSLLISDLKLDTFVQASVPVTFDEERVDNFVDKIAKSIDRPTKDAGVRFENGKVVAYTEAIDGQLLDRSKVKKLVLNNILVEAVDSDAKSTINLPVITKKAKITNNEINSLGINERIGSGISYFAGSIPNRISNITLGSKLISGAIIAPGEIFSFTNLVGPVSAEQGFKKAYVINKGKTVLDDGGGICQVSTTVFRAALNSGLPILKRTAHAYRVGYYEQNGFKPGLDATIFSPSVDFQFKNDTAKHILIQAVVDVGHSKLQIDIFGTGDGRRVELGNVLVSNIISAPEPLYQDDLTIPNGTVKQVEHAANGATTIFSRKVYKGDLLIIDESFKSVFRPWQAVFLVGKG